MEAGLIAMALLYAFALAVLGIGLHRIPRSGRCNGAELPTVSVLVAARNEERRLGPLLRSIVRLDYPTERLDIWLIDDRSTDRTPELCQELARRHGHVHYLRITEIWAGLKGKVNALAQAAHRARGEWLFFTDADCEVPPNWIRGALSHVRERTGLLCGLTVIAPETAVGRLERVVWAFLAPFTAGLAGWGFRFTALGNNLAVRRTAYWETGGYERIPFSVTEDYALLRAVRDRGWEIAWFVDPETTVSARPVESLRALLDQLRRWQKGGLEAPRPERMRLLLVLALGWMLHLGLVVGWFWSPSATTVAWGLKLGADAQLLWQLRRRLRLRRVMRYLPLLELFMLPTLLLLPFSWLISKRVHWKGQRF
ncbi:MAG: glycosyltransferase [Bacteroidetes bacterium]|nr:glycosyltransferase [Rhodothermia bacterium]MCS7155380.1 glycosyltransferase [Bacteroidota bacterium]MCX7907527.1 glycosyltransferase [Bacteroidota bacterium]MDW8138521.1 glycosyltransferase [Bacteroidota bacterium]MDW8284542.1 glycosyltransferase [Bacteroidota bacterium]